jgi:hypothetical protein
MMHVRAILSPRTVFVRGGNPIACAQNEKEGPSGNPLLATGLLVAAIGPGGTLFPDARERGV